MKLFAAATAISESKPWFFSLIHQSCEFWEKKRNPPKLVEITAAPVEVPEMWSEHKARVPRLLSILVHVAAVALVLIASTAPPKRLPKGVINVALYAPHRLVLPADTASGGGGGGGRRQLTPPSLGKLPKAADKQLVPPDADPPKNLDPALIVESSVVAPQLAFLPQLNLLNIGDPDGIPGPPSAGSGSGYGIGTGDGRGDGEGKGPGVGPGENGGNGGGDPIFRVGGAVSRPVLVTQVLPEYSEEARKARFQGRVVLDTIVLADGSVQVVRVARGIGFGLDERAVTAVLQWKFKPARMNGKPVPVALNVEVSFNIR
jgi:periplasmic protein TonB